MEQIEVNFENLTEDEQTQLRELINKANCKKWMPKQGERYYVVELSSYGYYDTFYFWDNGTIDKTKKDNNILYRTQKEAEFAAEKKNVERELELFAYKHNERIDWLDDETKFSIFYNHAIKSLRIEHAMACEMQGTIYFSSEELCRQAIEKVGEERIKKYLFGVE